MKSQTAKTHFYVYSWISVAWQLETPVKSRTCHNQLISGKIKFPSVFFRYGFFSPLIKKMSAGETMRYRRSQSMPLRDTQQGEVSLGFSAESSSNSNDNSQKKLVFYDDFSLPSADASNQETEQKVWIKKCNLMISNLSLSTMFFLQKSYFSNNKLKEFLIYKSEDFCFFSFEIYNLSYWKSSRSSKTSKKP